LMRCLATPARYLFLLASIHRCKPAIFFGHFPSSSMLLCVKEGAATSVPRCAR
jgi:hypothetical protein